MVTMIFLATFSIIVVSSMESTVITAKVSTNTLNNKLTFQSAETAIASALEDYTLLNSAIIQGAGPTTTEYKFADLPAASLTTAKVDVEYISENAVPTNYSLGSGFSAIHFKAVGRGYMKNNAELESINTQGFYRIVPSSY